MLFGDMPFSKFRAKKKAVETAEIPLRCSHTKIVPTLCVGTIKISLTYLFGCGVRRRYGFTAR